MVKINKIQIHTDVLKKANKKKIPIATLETDLGIYKGSIRKLLLETNHRAEVLIAIIQYTGNKVEHYIIKKENE